jgi:hypothetical protein
VSSCARLCSPVYRFDSHVHCHWVVARVQGRDGAGMEVDAEAEAALLAPKAPTLKPIAPDANFVDDDELQVPHSVPLSVCLSVCLSICLSMSRGRAQTRISIFARVFVCIGVRAHFY